MAEWIDEVAIDAEEIVAETPSVILARLEDRELWIPKSQISDNSEVYKNGHSGSLIVSPWYAEKNGLT